MGEGAGALTAMCVYVGMNMSVTKLLSPGIRMYSPTMSASCVEGDGGERVRTCR